MDLKEISKVLSYPIDDETKKMLIITILAKDKQVIPTIMEILDAEREINNKLLIEMNMQLSRAHLGLEKPSLNKGHFMDKEIQQFYLKNKEHIGHCFKNLSNIEPDKDEGFYT